MKITRVFDFLYHQAENYPLSKSISHKVAGEWKSYSTQEALDIVNRLTWGLIQLGVQKDDKIAIASANRPEWNLIDLAMQQVGAVSVPIYTTMTTEVYEYICGHAEVDYIFIDGEELFEKIQKVAEKRPFKGVYSFDKIENCKHWTEVEELGKDVNLDDLKPYKRKVSSNDVLTIIYTSGTTGTPKGVMLTHKNIISNVNGVTPRLPVELGKARALSFLPLSHIFERTGFYVYLYIGAGVYYAESIEKIADNIKDVKPQIFNTVPRLLEKIYDKIVAKGKDLTGIKKTLFFWALDLGLKYEPHIDQGWWYNQQLNLARKLIFSKWQEALGGDIKGIVSGGAALQPRLVRVFWAAQIMICEAYGLTETSPGLTSNLMDPLGVRAGTVGIPFNGVEIKIADDGEILAKGRGVMKGYYKEPEKTAEVIKDGWFHTGDIGTLIEGKFLKITDRKKSMFKTSGGKYIAPQALENKVKESAYIEQVMVVGNGRKFPAALFVPNFEALKVWAEDEGISYASDAEIIKHKDVLSLIDSELEIINKGFGKWEQIKRYALLPRLWSIEDGELTPKMSMKRKVILEKYSKEVEEIYNV
jgi:long-chain acyl-CoA synthetase